MKQAKPTETLSTPRKTKFADLTLEERRQRVMEIAGKYAGILSVDEYLQRKHEEHRAEECRERRS